jgi:hypothetical protein
MKKIETHVLTFLNLRKSKEDYVINQKKWQTKAVVPFTAAA